MPLNHTSQYSELTDEQFSLVGRLVVEWSNIEFLFGVLLGRLLFTPEFLGRIYTDEMSASRVQEAIKKAVEIHRHRYGFRIVPSEILDEIVKLNSDVEKLRGLRNRFSHFCWCRTTDEEIFGSGLSGFVPPSKRVDKDSMKVSVTELRDIYRDAYQLVERLSGVIQKLPETDEGESLTLRIDATRSVASIQCSRSRGGPGKAV
jgi:hypothetical protein